jgi:hypothetical protein
MILLSAIAIVAGFHLPLVVFPLTGGSVLRFLFELFLRCSNLGLKIFTTLEFSRYLITALVLDLVFPLSPGKQFRDLELQFLFELSRPVIADALVNRRVRLDLAPVDAHRSDLQNLQFLRE